jgi:hypothetical protein
LQMKYSSVCEFQFWTRNHLCVHFDVSMWKLQFLLEFIKK